MIAAKATFKRMKATATMSRVNIVSADLAQVLLDLDNLNGETVGTTADDKITFAEGWRDDIKTAIEAYSISMVSAKPADYDSKVALIGPTVAAPIKTALDTANEEASISVDAAIDLVESNYAAIKAAITGVDMTGVKPSGYDEKIKQIGDKYTRPSFWPALPDIAVDENGENLESVVYLLIAVFPDTGGDVGFFINQTGTAAWGDGSVEAISNAANTFHHYEYENLLGSPNERGYKTVIAEIRPSNGLLSYFNTTTYSRIDNVGTVLDCKIALMPAAVGAAQLYLSGTMLEIVTVIGKPNIASYGLGSGPASRQIAIDTSKTVAAGDLFRRDSNLHQHPVLLPAVLNLTAAGSADALMFGVTPAETVRLIMPATPITCASLCYVARFLRALEIENAGSITTLASAFYSCANLGKLSIQGVKVAFDISGCNFYFDELKRIIENDLGTPATTATMTITNNPGAAAIIAAIAAGTITVPAGWTVTS